MSSPSVSFRISDDAVLQPCTCPFCIASGSVDEGAEAGPSACAREEDDSAVAEDDDDDSSSDEEEADDDLVTPRTDAYLAEADLWDQRQTTKQSKRSGGKGTVYDRNLKKHVKKTDRVRAVTYEKKITKRAIVDEQAERTKENRLASLAMRLSLMGLSLREPSTIDSGNRNGPTTAGYTRRLVRTLGVDEQLAQLLEQLQHRDATPADYDLLLRLDETVKPKTLSSTRLQVFPTDTLNDDAATLLSSELCLVCMDDFPSGTVVRRLPCGHVFHRDCIDTWLTERSVKCPLDNIDMSQ